MKRKITLLFLIIAVLSMSSGCNRVETNHILSTKEELEQKNAIGSHPNASDEIIELRLWSYYGGWELYIEAFQEKHPNIHIKPEIFPYDAYPNIVLNALIEGNAGDIIVFDSPHFGTFNGVDGLQDLLQSPFSAEKYKNDFSESLWKVGLSFDQKQLLGIPFNTSPKVTFYRADIMEQYGFPSDPDALAGFIENPYNWLEIARRLKKDDKWISQWPYDPVEIFESQTGLFDEKLNFLRDNKTFYQAIDIAKIIHKENLARYINIWDTSGQEEIRENKIAMLYLGSWGSGQIEAWAPEQSGKWRVTKLPFGVNGSSNVSIISISDSSEYKEAAWKFTNYFAFEALGENMIGSVSGYLPARHHPNIIDYTNDFLGGQKEQVFYEEIQSEIKEYTSTPLDEKAKSIWKDGIYQGLDWGMDPAEIVQRIISQLEVELGKDRDILIRSLQ